MRQILLALAALCAMGAALAPFPGPLLLYNGSPSAPVGFFVRDSNPIGVGSYVIVRARDVAPRYAAFRGFDGPRNYFIKRVAAIAGARVCAWRDHIIVDGRRLDRQTQDRFGRALPAWAGCGVLGSDQVFLVGDTADSFDSRYWGPVRLEQLAGRWRPIGAASALTRQFARPH